MQKKVIQMPLPFVYDEVEDAINKQQPEFLSCLDNYIDFDKLQTRLLQTRRQKT